MRRIGDDDLHQMSIARHDCFDQECFTLDQCSLSHTSFASPLHLLLDFLRHLLLLLHMLCRLGYFLLWEKVRRRS